MADGRTKFASQLNDFSKSKRVRSLSIMCLPATSWSQAIFHSRPRPAGLNDLDTHDIDGYLGNVYGNVCNLVCCFLTGNCMGGPGFVDGVSHSLDENFMDTPTIIIM